MNPFERETVVTSSDGDDFVSVYTCQRRYISRLRKHPKAVETGSGTHEGTEWVTFRIPAKQWSPVSGIKRTSTLTPEQRAASAERLRRARNGRLSVED